MSLSKQIIAISANTYNARRSEANLADTKNENEKMDSNGVNNAKNPNGNRRGRAKKKGNSNSVKEVKNTAAENEKNNTKQNETKNAAKSVSKNANVTQARKPKKQRPKKKQEPKHSDKIKVIPLGGLDQIGMNMTAIEYEDTIIVLDCGMSFADDTLLGIDLIIPDITYLKKNRKKVKAFLISHGHEDHIGAVPYVLKEINVPVYGTKLSMALIDRKLEEHKIADSCEVNVIDYGQPLKIGGIDVEFIRTNHSISDAAAIALRMPAGTVVFTGDFKVDYTPVYGDSIDFWRLAEIGKEGVLAVLNDSTNALRPGYTMSERKVGARLDSIFAEHTKQRLIITTFSSNVDRVQQIINSAYKYKRKVVLEGRSMVRVIDTATELGYIKMPKNTLISIDEMSNYPDNKIVIVTTGSQGESMAALSRMAARNHKKIDIKNGDVIVFSSSPIPGNEKAVNSLMNELSLLGAEVIFEQTHVSGHACQEEIKLIYSLLKPEYIIPVHGEFRHRTASAELAHEMGYPEKKVIIAELGDVIEISQKSAKIVDHVQAGGIYVDNSGVEDVGRTIIEDRKGLAEKGVLIVTVCIDITNHFIISGPEIFTRGWVYDGDSEVLIEELREIIYNALETYLEKNHYNRGKTKMIIGDEVRKYVKGQNNKGPMILPFILEVE